jgi:hypothetical protein
MDQDEEIPGSEDGEKMSPSPPVESLPLVAQSIRIPAPAFDVESREEWTALEKTIFDQVSGSHSCTKDNHSAHKCRTAFAAAGQLVGEADIEERLATSLGMGNLTDRKELLRLAKLPEINLEKLQLNCNVKWMEVVEEATRTILAHFLQLEPEAKTKRRVAGSPAAPRDQEALHRRSADHGIADAARDPTPKNQSVLLTRHDVVNLSTPPPAREAATKRSARAPHREQMVNMNMYDLSSSTSGDESSSSDSSPIDRKTRSRSAHPSPLSQAATIASTESDSSSPESEREQTRLIIKRKAKPQQGPSQANDGPPAGPTVAVLQGGARTKSTPTPSRAVRGAAVTSPLRQQTRPHEALLKTISTIHQGCSQLDPESLNAILRSVASILQQSVDESVETKATMERLSQTNITLTARVTQLEQLLTAAIADRATTGTTASRATESQAVSTAAPVSRYTVEKVKGDGECLFTSIEKAKGWKKGEAKARIIRFLMSKAAPADIELPSIVGGIDELQNIALGSLRSEYFAQLSMPGYHGGEAEATFLTMEQQGNLRIVFLQTTGKGEQKVYQQIGKAPQEEVILYHSTCNYADSDARPNHFDLVCEVVPGGSPRYVWSLTVEEAAATTESVIPRWTYARMACEERNRQKQRPQAATTHAPAAVGNSAVPQATGRPSYAGKAAAGQASLMASSSRGHTKAPVAQFAQPVSNQSKGPQPSQASGSVDKVDWCTKSRGQRGKQQTKSMQPWIVITNLRAGTTKEQFEQAAAARQIDLSTARVETLYNAGRRSSRAVLHLSSKSEAVILERTLRGLAPEQGSEEWNVEIYKDPGARGPPGGYQSAAPQAKKLGQQLVSAPAQLKQAKGWYRGLCTLAPTQVDCRRGTGCPFFHNPGKHVTGRIPTRAEVADLKAAGRRE